MCSSASSDDIMQREPLTVPLLRLCIVYRPHQCYYIPLCNHEPPSMPSVVTLCADGAFLSTNVVPKSCGPGFGIESRLGHFSLSSFRSRCVVGSTGDCFDDGKSGPWESRLVAMLDFTSSLVSEDLRCTLEGSSLPTADDPSIY